MVKIRVLLADDHQIVIDGLRLILEKEENIEVVGQALNGNAVLRFLDTKSVDVVVLDIQMPELNGIEVTKHITDVYPLTKVLILSMHKKKDFIKALMEAGALGYILKNTRKTELVQAIKEVARNKTFYGREIMDVLIKDPNKNVKLTKREIQVLKLIVQEYSTAQIAKKINRSEATINTFRRNLLSKLNVKGVVGLVKYAIKEGYWEEK